MSDVIIPVYIANQQVGMEVNSAEMLRATLDFCFQSRVLRRRRGRGEEEDQEEGEKKEAKQY